MLDVLLAADRPMRRELPALVFGGLRARNGGHQTVSQKWLWAIRAAALVLVVISALGRAQDIAAGWSPLTATQIFQWVAAALAVTAVMAGRRLPAPIFALTAFVLGVVGAAGDWRAATGYALATALLLIPGSRTAVHSPVPLLLAIAAAFTVSTVTWILLAAAVVVWAVVDERIVIAIGLTLGAPVVQAIAYLPGNETRAILSLAGGELGYVGVLVGLGTLIAVRRARV
jgi:hypothetical protein